MQGNLTVEDEEAATAINSEGVAEPSLELNRLLARCQCFQRVEDAAIDRDALAQPARSFAK